MSGADRFYPERASRTRSEFRRDYDRILYSTAFRRLAEVTQVVSEERGHVFHNRLTHSLKVSQTARTLAGSLAARNPDLDLEQLNPIAAESAALAHDLGHPPFGHTGENTLNKLADEVACGGFEGNAQSFRIVNRLSVRSLEHEGLNLARCTLGALLKYPWQRGQSGKAKKKWGAYESESKELQFALEGQGSPTLEAQIMDWSDDITYAIHDLQDFYRAGLLPLDQLARDPGERQLVIEGLVDEDNSPALRSPFESLNKQEVSNAFSEISQFFLLGFERPYEGRARHRALLNRSASVLLHRYSEAMSIQESPEGRLVARIEDAARLEVDLLKELTWFYVINRPSLATMRLGQARLVRQLFEAFLEASRTKSSWPVFPASISERLANGPSDSDDEDAERQRARVVIDFISGMTESQAQGLFSRVSGTNLGSIFEGPG